MNQRCLFKMYDLFTPFATIPMIIKVQRLFEIIDRCFFNKNGSRKFSHLVMGHLKIWIVKIHSDCVHRYSEDDTKKIIVFLIVNIYVFSEIRYSNNLLKFPWASISLHVSRSISIFVWSKIYSKTYAWKNKITRCGLHFDICVYGRRIID